MSDATRDLVALAGRTPPPYLMLLDREGNVTFEAP